MRIVQPEQSVHITFPQASNFALFVQEGEFIWQGEVVAVGPYGVGQSLWVSTLAGNSALVKKDMTCWFGADTAERAKSHGMTRCVLMPATTNIIVAPASFNINVGDIISVDRFPVVQAINSYHDRPDMGLTSSPYPPYVNFGPHRAGYTGENVYFYADQSWPQHGRTIVSWQWDFGADAVVAYGLNTANSPGTVLIPHVAYWQNPGDFVVSLTITDSAGATWTGHRIVMIRDRVGRGSSHEPYTDFTVGSCGGSYTDGGWTAEITLHGVADVPTFPDGAAVVLTSNDTFNGNPSDNGGLAWLTHQVFCGQIVGTSVVSQGDETYNVTLQVATPHVTAKELTLWPVNFAPANAPTAGHDYANVTLQECIAHLLQQHSTYATWNDCLVYNMDSRVDYLDLPETNLWEMLATEIGPSKFATPVCNRFGQLFIQTDANHRTQDQRVSFGPAEALLDNKWWSQLDLGQEYTRNRCAQVDAIGAYICTLSAASATNLSSIFHLYPPNQTSYGTVEKLEGFIVNAPDETSAAWQVAQQAQLHFAAKNLRFPVVTMETYNVRHWDVADQPYLALKVGINDTNRGVVWDHKEFIVRDVSYEINTNDGYMRVTYGMEESIWGNLGTYAEYPEGSNGPDHTPYTVPPGVEVRTGRNLLACDRFGVFLCDDVWASPSNISWEDRTGNLATDIPLGRTINATSPRVNGVERDPYAPASTWWVWGQFGICKTTNAGELWVGVCDKYKFTAKWNASNPPIAAAELTAFAVIRHISPPQPQGWHGALVVTKQTDRPNYSKLYFMATADDWVTISHIKLISSYLYDPGNYGSPTLAHIVAHPWPYRQPQGKHLVFVTAAQADLTTCYLWGSQNGGQLWQTYASGDTYYYGGIPVDRLVIPPANNDSGGRLYWMSSGQLGTNGWYATSVADQGPNQNAWTRREGAPPVTGPSFGVSVDAPMSLYSSSSPQIMYAHAAGYGQFEAFWTRYNNGPWQPKAAPPNGGVMYSGFASFMPRFDTAYIGCQLPRNSASTGRIWATNNEGSSWRDITGNLPLIQADNTSQYYALWGLSPDPNL